MSTIRDRSVVTSSVMPSAKYCCCGSLPMLAKGSTTIDRRGGGCEPRSPGKYKIPTTTTAATRTRAPMAAAAIPRRNGRRTRDVCGCGIPSFQPGATASRNWPSPGRGSDAGKVVGSTRLTGATNRYPRPGTVWMQLPCAPSRSSARRNAEIWVVRLLSSTTVSGQAAAMISSLVTSSPGL